MWKSKELSRFSGIDSTLSICFAYLQPFIKLLTVMLKCLIGGHNERT